MASNSIGLFFGGLPLVFQPDHAKGLSARYHITFTGAESRKETVDIRDHKLKVIEGDERDDDLFVTADSEDWLGFLAKERSLVWELVTRIIRLTMLSKAAQPLQSLLYRMNGQGYPPAECLRSAQVPSR